MKLLPVLLWPVVLGSALTVVGAAFGAAHPILDSLGVGLIYGQVAVLFATLGFIALRRWRSAAVGALVAGSAFALLLPLSGDFITRPVGQMALVQHNLLYSNTALDLPLRIAGTDVVTLQEVGAARPVLLGLPLEWTTQICDYTVLFDSAVTTRWPVVDAGCMDGAAWVQADTPDGPVTFVSLHLRWPWPKGQAAHIAALEPQLRALPRPVVVAGDFNQVPWSAAVARIAAATDTRVVPGQRITLRQFGGWLRIPIDHVLVPRDWAGTAQTSGAFGSDHQALTAQIGPWLSE